MSNPHPELPPTGMNPLLADAISIHELLQTFVDAGWKQADAMKYLAIAGSVNGDRQPSPLLTPQESAELSPLDMEAFGIFEATQSLIKAGFTRDDAFQYIAIRSVHPVTAPTECKNCGHKP